MEEEGEVVLVTEHRTTDGGSREGQVVIRVSFVMKLYGTLEKLKINRMDFVKFASVTILRTAHCI